MTTLSRCILPLVITGLLACDGGSIQSPPVDPVLVKQQLGEALFFDTNLSTPEGQACVSCHDPAASFADPDDQFPVSQGVHEDRFGSRNAPTVAYAGFAPEFHFNEILQEYFGGQFVDGRALDLVEQAKQPFLNPLEMANPDELSVVEKVRNADYVDLFYQVYGENSLDDASSAFGLIADAIAEFEGAEQVSPFTSKFDYFFSGQVQLTDQERRGFVLFDGKGLCFSCHPLPLFTDYSYRNLGVPKNPDNPFYDMPAEFNPDGENFIDLGLGANPEVLSSLENGKFKVPTLRNIRLTPPYMHNGVFQTLEEVMDFYNTRDVDPTWPPPEVAENMDTELLGDLGLTADEIADIIVFLDTLTDGYTPP